MKRITFHIIPFFILFSITLQNASYLVQSSMETPVFMISDSADEKNSEGKETKTLDNEKDDKIVSFILVSLTGLNPLNSEHRFHFYPTDHIIDVISPPPEMS